MKFINLLKKELSELCNAQMFLGLLVAVIIFGLMGGIMKDSIDEVVEESAERITEYLNRNIDSK